MVNANQMFATETRAPRANRKGREGKRPIETAVDERTQTKGGIVWQDTDFAKISRTCDTTAPNPGCLFSLVGRYFHFGGDETATLLSLATLNGDNRKDMADRVARSTARFCSREGNRC